MCYNSAKQTNEADNEDFTSMVKDQKEATMKDFKKAGGKGSVQAASDASSNRD